jgi:hypothetical protein
LVAHSALCQPRGGACAGAAQACQIDPTLAAEAARYRWYGGSLTVEAVSLQESVMKRYALAAAVFAMGLSGAALAQDNSSSSNGSTPQSSSQQPSSDKMAAQDPKMKKCMASQKAKNDGLSDDQIKQKCMAHIMSHQNKADQQQSSPQ